MKKLFMRLNFYEIRKNWCTSRSCNKPQLVHRLAPSSARPIFKEMAFAVCQKEFKGECVQQLKQNPSLLNFEKSEIHVQASSTGTSYPGLFTIYCIQKAISFQAIGLPVITCTSQNYIPVGLGLKQYQHGCPFISGSKLTGGLSYFEQLRGIHQRSAKDDSKPVSPAQKLKLAVKVYGGTVIVVHVVVSLVSLGCCYLAITSGLDMERVLTSLDLGSSSVATAGGGFVLAYAVHKLLAPLRIAVTLSCTPFLVRYFRKVGILKK